MNHPELFFTCAILRRRIPLIVAAIMTLTIGAERQSAAQVRADLPPADRAAQVKADRAAQLEAAQVKGAARLRAAQAQIQARQDILAMYVFNGVDEATFKKQLDDQAKLVVDRIVKITSINDVQRQKLTLAATGDLHRFYRELEAVREKTKEFDIQNQEQMQKAWQIISPVQQRVQAGILNETSLLEKLLGTVLTVEQRTAYDEYLQKRERNLCTAVLHATIADLEKSMPLTVEQRTKLLVLLEANPFPKKVQNGFLYNVGWVLLARLDGTEVAKILDDSQHKTFKRIAKQFENQAGGLTW